MIIKPKLETEVTEKYEKHWVEDFEQIESLFLKDNPKLCVLDSETTGLHIIKDRPLCGFLVGCCPGIKEQLS